MEDTALSRDFRSNFSGWSNRILIAALVGILFLTLYPFRFSLVAALPSNVSPFLLGRGSKAGRRMDIFLNVLLFVPFGFGLSEKFRERGRSRLRSLLIVIAAGACLSYLIELTQLYIPQRDSGWTDVLTNSSGSGVGFVLFEYCGGAVLRFLSQTEAFIERCSSMRCTALILVIYFCAWFAISATLQKKTALNNWIPDSVLSIGSNAPERPERTWKGRVSRLQLWDRALPGGLARKLTAGEMRQGAPQGLRGDFDLRGPGPFRDQSGSLPDLVFAPKLIAQPAGDAVALNGTSWLTSRGAVRQFVTDLQTTGQFALRVVCAPSEVKDAEGRIVSISDPSGRVNLYIRQANKGIVLWFRNPLSIRRAALAWLVPDVFAADQTRDILYSYDASNLSLYVNGSEYPRVYRLGPGTGLARLLHPVTTNELEGYSYIYYALVFFPCGCLLGLAVRREDFRRIAGRAVLAFGLLLPPLVFEFILTHVSGRPLSAANAIFSLILIVVGALWINADRKLVRSEAVLAGLPTPR